MENIVENNIKTRNYFAFKDTSILPPYAPVFLFCRLSPAFINKIQESVLRLSDSEIDLITVEDDVYMLNPKMQKETKTLKATAIINHHENWIIVIQLSEGSKAIYRKDGKKLSHLC